mgnify:CR=1 FL=1
MRDGAYPSPTIISSEKIIASLWGKAHKALLWPLDRNFLFSPTHGFARMSFGPLLVGLLLRLDPLEMLFDILAVIATIAHPLGAVDLELLAPQAVPADAWRNTSSPKLPVLGYRAAPWQSPDVFFNRSWHQGTSQRHRRCLEGCLEASRVELTKQHGSPTHPPTGEPPRGLF